MRTGYPSAAALAASSSSVRPVASTPGTVGTPLAATVALALILSPIASIAAGGGPTNTMPASGAGVGEGGVLGEEPVAGVQRLRARRLGGANHPFDVEVALDRRRRAEPLCLVGLDDVTGAGVGIAVDGDRADAEAPQRAR